MAVKHVREYYNKVCEQYHEMIENLHELEEYATTHIVNPEAIDNLKATIAPIKTNYQTLSWIIFLLNKPNKKEKAKKWERANKKLLQDVKTDEEVYRENNICINNLKNSFGE